MKLHVVIITCHCYKLHVKNLLGTDHLTFELGGGVGKSGFFCKNFFLVFDHAAAIYFMKKQRF